MRKIILFMQVSLDGFFGGPDRDISCCSATPRSRRCGYPPRHVPVARPCGTPLRHVPAALLKRFLNAGRESGRWCLSGRPLPRAGGSHDWTRPC
jgi:hypothetical protein